MSGEPAGIPAADHARRVEALRAAAEREGLDCVLAYGTSMRPAHVLYLTGYVPTNGAALVVVGPDSVALLVDQGWDVARAREASWLEPAAVRPSDDLARDALLELPAAPRRIGVVGWGILPAPVHLGLARGVDAPDVVDVTGDLVALRQLKSDAEVSLLREAGRITSAGAAAFAAGVVAGADERELALAVETAMRRAGSGPLAFPLVLGGGADATATAVPFPADRRLAPGEPVLLDCGGTALGYCGDLARTATAGPPSDALRALLEATLAAYEAGVAALRPGARADEVHAACVETARARGYEMPFLVGHGIGCENQEPPRLDGLDTTTLAEGMVVTVEPGIYVPGLGGARIEDTFLVTRDGCEALTHGPLALWS